MSKHWKASRELSQLIDTQLKLRDGIFKQARAWARELNADVNRIIYSDDHTGTRIIGFVFPDGVPDQEGKHWCQIPNHPGAWRPRSGTAQAKRLEEMRCNVFQLVMDKIKMQAAACADGGIELRRPGLAMANKVGYLTLPDDVTPIGCTRISDLTWERATTPQEVKRAQKKLAKQRSD